MGASRFIQLFLPITRGSQSLVLSQDQGRNWHSWGHPLLSRETELAYKSEKLSRWSTWGLWAASGDGLL